MNRKTSAWMLLEKEESEGFKVEGAVFDTLKEIFSRYDGTNKDAVDAEAHFASVDQVLKDMGFEYNRSLDDYEYRYDINRGVTVRFLGSNLLSASLLVRKISCFHYCLIHESVSDIMRYPVKMMLVRGTNHMFMRWRYDKDTYINYEPTSNQLGVPDDCYTTNMHSVFECDEGIHRSQVYYHLGTEWPGHS